MFLLYISPMDLGGLTDYVWAERDTVIAHAPAFAATGFIAAGVGWTVAYLYWKQRLDHFRDVNDSLRAAVEGKIPAEAAIRRTVPKRGNKTVSWGLAFVLMGFGLAAIGSLTIYLGNKPIIAISPPPEPKPTLTPPSITPPSEPAKPTVADKPQPTPPAVPSAPLPPDPLFASYRLTEAGIDALAEELYKIKAAAPAGDIRWLNYDGATLSLATDISKAFDRANIQNSLNFGRPNSPSEKGVMVQVRDPSHPPEIAKNALAALDKVGMKPKLTSGDVAPDSFAIFVGPRPPAT